MSIQEKIGIPTFSGIKSSMVSYAVGAGGGLVYQLISGFVGSGFWGSLISAGLVGATVKGVKGEMLATILGFNAVTNGNMSIGGLFNTATETVRTVI